MNGITELPLASELDTAIDNLLEAGFEFTVVSTEADTPRAA